MKKVLTLAAVAMLFGSLAGASAFADQRNPEGTWREGQYQRDDSRDRDRDYDRDHDRVTVEGRIARVFRDRGGLRIELDRDRRSFWIPEARLGGRELREGLSIRMNGVFRDGVVYVDDFGYQDGYRRDSDDRQIRGVVDRVNYRLNYLVLREWDGDFIRVDLRPLRHYDLRRGDAISISGDWARDGLFRAEHIDRIRRGW